MITERLLQAGARPVAVQQAALLLILTCVVTAEAEAKTRQAVRRLLTENNQAPLLVSGCAASIHPHFFRELSPRIQVVADPCQLLPSALELLNLPEPAAEAVGSVTMEPAATALPEPAATATLPTAPASASPLLLYPHRQRLSLKVQDGCAAHCSYCLVRVARGLPRSEPLPELLYRAQTWEAQGLREIVLTGVNLGSYRWQGQGLVELLAGLLQSTSRCRFRLSSLEPLDAGPELIALIAAHPGRICAHLHLPLQSGSDRILAAMRRPYNAAKYLRLVETARQCLPQLALSSDIIVGFPGESDADFQATLELCQQLALMRLHVFRYSARPGTPAAQLPDTVDPVRAAARAAQLRQLAQQLAAADRQRRVDRREDVLIERPGWGRSESYHLVRCDSQYCPGTLLPMTFVATEADYLIGQTSADTRC